MKKILLAIMSLAMACGIGVAAVGCGGNGSDSIVVIGREASSGTREAFDKAVVNAEGESLDDYSSSQNPDEEEHAGYVSGAIYLGGTGDVASRVASTKDAIGYISLGSVDESVKDLKIEGVEATESNVLDGKYAIQRPFVVMKRDASKGELQGLAADFYSFLTSEEAQGYMEEAGVISLTDTDLRDGQEVTQYTALSAKPATGDKIVIRGSTSMTDTINIMIREYVELNSGWCTNEMFDLQLQGSSYGRDAVDGDTTCNIIGLASSSEAESDTRDHFNIALDAVAVIVNPDNELSDITLEQLYDIYTGAITTWSELTGTEA